VQYYLIKITYDYKVAQFHSEIKEYIDSAYVNKKELLYKQLAQNYVLDKKSKNFY
jgi:hypothetical protein